MISACGQQFTLALDTPSGRLTAMIAQVGASLRSLKLGATEFVLSCEPDEIAPYCAGIVMSPWVNRLDGGKWTHKGQVIDVPITIHDQQNANHGLLEFAEYRLVDRVDTAAESSVTLAATIQPRRGYPFLVETSVKYALHADGLTVTHGAINRSADAAPYAVGGHPYLQVSGTPTEQLVLRAPAASVIDVNERQIPIGRSSVVNTHFDLRNGQLVGDNFFDHNFADLEREADGLAHTYLTAPNGGQVDVWQDEAFKYVVLFTPDFYPTRDGKVWAAAIEPQTSAANSFNTGEDLIWLDQGREFKASWGIKVREPQA
jgi:aldose 1-epimerase